MKPLDFTKPTKIQLSIDNQLIDCDIKNDIATFKDVKVGFSESKYGADLMVDAKESLISHVYLIYEFPLDEDVLVMGDVIERGYGDLSWSKPNPDRQMFWYFYCYKELSKQLYACGVGVQPHSIVSFYLKDNTLLVDVNVQSGGSGVNLQGRTLLAATFIEHNYLDGDVFDNCRDFLKRLMMDIKAKPLKESVYGFNNWYYAYGNSSYQEIVGDTCLLEELTKECQIRPFMVIDDGWSPYPCSGPWEANEKFIDMSKLCLEIKSHNIKPGLWIRPMMDSSDVLSNHRHPLQKTLLDPTSKEVKEHVFNVLKKVTSWGYQLIKFDYITYDIFLKYAFEMPKDLCEQGFRFEDNHFTNAEIILDLYKLIREACGNAILIGCNTISHLCAGIVEINRIGDDTSGLEWERTRKMGVNSLAFRLIQNDIFYKIDADCVGIAGKIEWKQNKEWLKLLAKSGSPLFVSCDPKVATEEIEKDLTEAFRINEIQTDICRPVDWMKTVLPEEWLINEELVTFNWNI